MLSKLNKSNYRSQAKGKSPDTQETWKDCHWPRLVHVDRAIHELPRCHQGVNDVPLTYYVIRKDKLAEWDPVANASSHEETLICHDYNQGVIWFKKFWSRLEGNVCRIVTKNGFESRRAITSSSAERNWKVNESLWSMELFRPRQQE